MNIYKFISKVALLGIIILPGFACDKIQDKPGCTLKTCDEVFKSIRIEFTNKNGEGISINDYNVVNLRTKQVVRTSVQNELLVAGFRIVADDTNLKEFSTEGDDVMISGTNPTTKQTKSITVKIAGGCSCHISKVSGPDQIVFD